MKYRPGRDSIDCDYLSRVPAGIDALIDECDQEITPETIGAIVVGCKSRGKFAAVRAIDAVLSQDKAMSTLAQISSEEIKTEQKNDTVIGKVRQMVECGTFPSKDIKKELDKKQKTLLNQWKCLEIDKNGLLVRKTKHRVQLVLPEKFRKIVYEELHEKMGHLAGERVVQLAKERFYWPFLAEDVEHYVSSVCQCLKRKKPNREQRAPLVNIHSSEPFELVSIDYLKLDKSKGYEYLLVVVDHFTRFVQVYPTRTNGGRPAADKLFNEYILRFGFPRKLHHDQGKEFTCKLFKRLQELAGVQASQTTPYHPQGDGQVERMNRTLKNMLKTLPEMYKSNWKDHVNKLAFAYNCTRNKATTFSPFQLLFGHSPRLPIDFMFSLHQDNENVSYKDYVDTWKKAMQQACNIAQRCAEKNAAMGKKSYDRKTFGATIRVGDRVLVRNLSERGGTGKLRSWWEDDVHVVVRKKDDNIPVYTVKRENGKGKERILHRNLLLPCEHLPLEIPDDTVAGSTEKTTAEKNVSKDVGEADRPTPVVEVEAPESKAGPRDKAKPACSDNTKFPCECSIPESRKKRKPVSQPIPIQIDAESSEDEADEKEADERRRRAVTLLNDIVISTPGLVFSHPVIENDAVENPLDEDPMMADVEVQSELPHLPDEIHDEDEQLSEDTINVNNDTEDTEPQVEFDVADMIPDAESTLIADQEAGIEVVDTDSATSSDFQDALDVPEIIDLDSVSEVFIDADENIAGSSNPRIGVDELFEGDDTTHEYNLQNVNWDESVATQSSEASAASEQSSSTGGQEDLVSDDEDVDISNFRRERGKRVSRRPKRTTYDSRGKPTFRRFSFMAKK